MRNDFTGCIIPPFANDKTDKKREITLEPSAIPVYINKLLEKSSEGLCENG